MRERPVTYIIVCALFAGLTACGPVSNDPQQYSTSREIRKEMAAPLSSKVRQLTSQERKDISNAFLKSKGVPVLESLPQIEDHSQARFRDARTVAGKCVVLYKLVQVANYEKTAAEAMEYFLKYHLWEYVSPEEKKYLIAKKPTEQQERDMRWRSENLNVLFWALGGFDKLSFPTEECDPATYKNFPDMEADPSAWINRAILRNPEEILDETDLIYRMHWATREANLKNRAMPAGLSDDVIMERHFALNWLTMYGDEWDDITTDT